MSDTIRLSAPNCGFLHQHVIGKHADDVLGVGSLATISPVKQHIARPAEIYFPGAVASPAEWWSDSLLLMFHNPLFCINTP